MINKILRRFDLVPSIGLAVGVTSLMFQTKVLYPWHEDISKQLDEMNKKIESVEKIENKNVQTTEVGKNKPAFL